MYRNINSTIRWTARRSSWSSRLTMFHPPTTAVTTSIPYQATSSLSMFATVGSGSSSSSSNGDNTNNGKTFSSEQRRPFWATRPAVEDDTTSKTVTATVVHTIDHKVNAAGAAAGLAIDEVLEKETKKAKAAKKKKIVDVKEDEEEEMDEEDEEEEKASAKPDPNTVNNSFIAGKIAADQKITKAFSKQIVDQVFDILSESIAQKKKISIPKFGVFATAIQKPKTMTNIKTKEKYAVPAKYRLTFKQSSVLRKKIAELEVSPEDLATLEAPK